MAEYHWNIRDEAPPEEVVTWCSELGFKFVYDLTIKQLASDTYEVTALQYDTNKDGLRYLTGVAIHDVHSGKPEFTRFPAAKAPEVRWPLELPEYFLERLH
jgi:hypothetical protein